MQQRMTFAAPARMSVENPNGTWYKTPWTEAAVREHLSLGGWFKKGHSVFDSRQTARIAGVEEEGQ